MLFGDMQLTQSRVICNSNYTSKSSTKFGDLDIGTFTYTIL